MSCFGGSKDVIGNLQQENRRLQQEIASTSAQLERVKAEKSDLATQLDRIKADTYGSSAREEAVRIKQENQTLQTGISFSTEQTDRDRELPELAGLFDSLDPNGTGSINLDVLWQGLVADPRYTDKASQILGAANHEGMVSKDAFVKRMSDMAGTFTEVQDDMVVVYRLFREIDADGNGAISLAELEKALKNLVDERHLELAKALREQVQMLKTLQISNGETPSDDGNSNGLSFIDFSRVVGTLPRVRGERLLWVQSLGMDGELAWLLEPGTVFDGLSGILQMSEDKLQSVCDKFSRRLPILLRKGVRKLRDRVEGSGAMSEAQEANSKFCGTAGAFHGRFATLNEFYQGPAGLQPNPKLLEGMNREHCMRDSSKRFFVTSNFLLHTTAEWEWFWVQNPLSESLPTDLQKRLKDNGKYPGEVGDILKECEIQISLLKASFEDAALQSCKEDLKHLLESTTQAAFDLLAVDGVTASATENQVKIRVQVSSNHRISKAVQEEIFGAGAKLGMKPYIRSVIEISDVSRSDSVHLEISKSEICMSLQENLARALGNLFDEKQHLRGARIISRQPAYYDKDHYDKDRIVLFIAIPSSDLESTPKIQDKLATFKLGEIDLAITAKEYEYCTSVNEATRQHKQGRSRQGTFDEFFVSDPIRDTQARLVTKGLAELIKEEVIALRLYTGPLFIFYNAVLRGYPISITDLLREENGEMNRFDTTILVICSGISKLSRLTDVPPNRLLYRGLGGMLLPDEFWKESAQGFKGGVEYGLMSLTTKRSVAVQYSGIKHKRGILLEIQAGRIDIGASINFLSQYPGIEEYLMPPLSCMEVIGHPQVEKTEYGEILVFPVRLNVNLKWLTVENLTQQRKVLLLSMAKNFSEEISNAAASQINEFLRIEQRRALGLFLEPFGDVSKVIIAPEEESVKFLSDTEQGTVGAPYLWVSSGKVYYEVEVMESSGYFAIGWAGTNFRGQFVGFDEMSWSTDSGGTCFHRGKVHGEPNSFDEIAVPGTVLGVALDLQNGTMRVSFNGVEKVVLGISEKIISVRPSPIAGGALFPAISGRNGCELVLNMGSTKFRHPPFSMDFTSLAVACRTRFVRDGATTIFKSLGLTKERIGAKIERAMLVLKATTPDEFNDNDNYKRILNEVMDFKECLLAQLETVMMLRKEGASLEQVKVCADADAADFYGKRLQDECPGLLWRRDILHGNFLTERVSIPLTLPACQVSLIWEGVLASESVNKVAMGGFARDHEILDLFSLLPSLNLLDSNIHDKKYGFAVSGLLMASNKLAQRAPNHTRVVREVNLRGIEFSPRCTDQLVQAVTLGSVGGWVTRVNKLNLEGSQAVNLKHALRRNDKPLEGPLGKEIKDLVEWAFVLGAVHAQNWPRLDLSGNEIAGACVGWVVAGLGRCWRLESLSLSGNEFGNDGAKTVGERLREISSLQTLQMASCGITAEGVIALLTVLEGLPSLVHVNLGGNKFGDNGATAVGMGLQKMTSLQTLQLASCGITAGGVEALATAIKGRPSLKNLNLGGELGGVRVETLRILLHAKADVNGKDLNGNAPIHEAAREGNVEVVLELIKDKADVLANNNAAWAPIHFAAYNGKVEAVRALIECKADVLAKNDNGNAPIHWAAYNGHVEAVLALIEGKANVLAKTNDGMTPLDLAMREKKEECAKVLLDASRI